MHNLEPGLTLMMVQPAADTPELRAYAHDWEARADDLVLATEDLELRSKLEAVTLLRYADLRNLQRASS